jgi:hypothetical protein
MKNMDGKFATLGLLSVLIVSVVFGSAAARADVVLDWNTIAVNTVMCCKNNYVGETARTSNLVDSTIQLSIPGFPG